MTEPEPDPPPAVIAGVGYRNLRDHSLGVMLADELAEESLPEGVGVYDLSYNPVAVIQWLEALDVDVRPRRMVFVSAVERGRAPGEVAAYRWDGVLPDEARIQRAVEDAVTGVIYLDNTLLVLGWFDPLDDDAEVVVIEVEPLEEAFGPDLSATLAPSYPRVKALALRLADDDDAVASLPLLPLGGGAATEGAGPPRPRAPESGPGDPHPAI